MRACKACKHWRALLLTLPRLTRVWRLFSGPERKGPTLPAGNRAYWSYRGQRHGSRCGPEWPQPSSRNCRAFGRARRMDTTKSAVPYKPRLLSQPTPNGRFVPIAGSLGEQPWTQRRLLTKYIGCVLPPVKRRGNGYLICYTSCLRHYDKSLVRGSQPRPASIAPNRFLRFSALNRCSYCLSSAKNAALRA